MSAKKRATPKAKRSAKAKPRRAPAAKATGSRSVAIAGGSRLSTVITGDTHVHGGVTPTERAKALATYLQLVATEARRLPLRAFDVRAADGSAESKPPDLARIFVALNTTTTRPGARKRGGQQPFPEMAEHAERMGKGAEQPLGALEAVAGNRQVVLLGDPGSGKSTLVNYIVTCLALHALQPKKGWLARLPGWPKVQTGTIPLRIIVRDLAAQLGAMGAPPGAGDLWTFVERMLERHRVSPAGDLLEQAADAGLVLFLFDGLDELPTAEHRTRVNALVAATRDRHPKARILVTCRTPSWADPASRVPGLEAFHLAPFDTRQVGAFIEGWYADLADRGLESAANASQLATDLTAAVQKGDLARLAGNPLLLTVMAVVHAHRGRLPEKRALLYKEVVDVLLFRWEASKTTAAEHAPQVMRLLRDVDRSERDLEKVLTDLAFEAQDTGRAANAEDAADIGRDRLLLGLAELHPERSGTWAEALVEALRQRAGVLVERAEGGPYAFPHRTLQEYFAGVKLSRDPACGALAARLAANPAKWREVVLLAVGRLVHDAGETERALALLHELCPEAEGGPAQETWRRAALAGDGLLEMGINRAKDSAQGRDLVARVPRRLVKLLDTNALVVAERARAGDTLGRLGDPRFDPERLWLPGDAMLGFIDVPAGPFTMGSDPADAGADSDEQPQHRVVLPRYMVGRYPVTVGQFSAYVGATGLQPGHPNCLKGLLNHPVSRVSWSEALAYCEWLTACLREAEWTPPKLRQLLAPEDGSQPWSITLPSEAEWEKAARGTADARAFPWGGEADPDFANYSATGLGWTSAVGCFPRGRSPVGCEDMAGNVWEWTRSLWGKGLGGYPYDPRDRRREDLTAGDDVRRVLRGGSFAYDDRLVRCAFRYGLHPRLRYDYFGFRLVASPSPHL